MRTRLVVFFAFLLPLGARAADAPRPDSIDAARGQLDALRADANAAKAGTHADGRPMIAVPQMHEVDSAPPPAPLLPAGTLEKNQRKRSANWLVDGVMKSEARGQRSRDGRGERAGRSDDRPRDRLLDDDSDSSDATDPSDPSDRADARTAANSRRGEREPAADEAGSRHAAAHDSVFNPLTQYMGDWLSPQDASLLRQTLNEPTDARHGPAPALPAAAVSASDSALGAALANFGGDAGPAAKPAYAPAKPEENPYLQSMALPEVAPPSTNSPATDSTPPQPALQPAPAAPEPPKPIIPDFAKPFDDDKYYKPLKRF